MERSISQKNRTTSEYTLQAGISAVPLVGSGVAQIPPGSQITVVNGFAEKPNLPADTVVVVWEKHQYAVFAADLHAKAMPLA